MGGDVDGGVVAVVGLAGLLGLVLGVPGAGNAGCWAPKGDPNPPYPPPPPPKGENADAIRSICCRVSGLDLMQMLVRKWVYCMKRENIHHLSKSFILESFSYSRSHRS